MGLEMALNEIFKIVYNVDMLYYTRYVKIWDVDNYYMYDE
jgi:hypothetical protein